MMKIFLIIVIVFLSLNLKAQPVDSLRHIVDISLEKMEQNSLHKKDIDWGAFKKMVYAETKGITDINTLINKFPLFFKELNDFHGAIGTPTSWISWKEGSPKRPWSAALDSGFEKLDKLKAERWNNIGYLRVPGNGAIRIEDVNKVTQRLVDTLCKINPSTINALIIDLRFNTGGNIWPMLAALGSIIGDGYIGGIQYVDDRKQTNDFIKDGKPFGNNQFYIIPNKNCDLPNSSIPVVVVCGVGTGSSGEKLLLAFKGRPNTIIIGEPTAGYITNNNNYELHKGIGLFLATGYMTDRTGRAYTESIQPDVLINGGDNFFDLNEDAKIKAAQKWLQAKIKL